MSLVSWLDRRITGRRQARRAPAGKAPSPFRPRLEALEGRDLPSFGAPVGYPLTEPLAVVAMVAADVNGDGKHDPFHERHLTASGAKAEPPPAALDRRVREARLL
jgi:hypothetical protein